MLIHLYLLLRFIILFIMSGILLSKKCEQKSLLKTNVFTFTVARLSTAEVNYVISAHTGMNHTLALSYEPCIYQHFDKKKSISNFICFTDSF